MTYQIGALSGFCAANSVKMRHVKPHGNLHISRRSKMKPWRRPLQRPLSALIQVSCTLLSPARKGGFYYPNRREVGPQVLDEAFPDRAYTPEGTLASRRVPGAVISDPKQVAERALKMAKEGKVVATDGTEIDLQVHTLCVHGDNPSAVDLVKTIRALLESEGMAVKPMGL